MAEVPDRVPGGVILASYANTIRDRTAQRYADQTARDASEPLPSAGTLAFIQNTGVLQVYDGAEWDDLATIGDISTVVDRRISAFVPSQSLSFTLSTIASLTAPISSDFMVKLYGTLLMDVTETTKDVLLNLNSSESGPIVNQWRFELDNFQQQSSQDIKAAFSLAVAYPLKGVSAGATLDFQAQTTSGSDINAQVLGAVMEIVPVPAGVMA